MYCFHCASQKVKYVVTVKIPYILGKKNCAIQCFVIFTKHFFRLKRIYGTAEVGVGRGAASRSATSLPHLSVSINPLQSKQMYL